MSKWCETCDDSADDCACAAYRQDYYDDLREHADRDEGRHA